jgi:nucleoside-diphosphate-sugar epimerase
MPFIFIFIAKDDRKCFDLFRLSSKKYRMIYLHEFLAGTPTYPNVSHELVNVKDVAMAHVLAYEVPSAKGRYCMAERVMHYSELVKIIQDMYPSIWVPDE